MEYLGHITAQVPKSARHLQCPLMMKSITCRFLKGHTAIGSIPNVVWSGIENLKRASHKRGDGRNHLKSQRHSHWDTYRLRPLLAKAISLDSSLMVFILECFVLTNTFLKVIRPVAESLRYYCTIENQYVFSVVRFQPTVLKLRN
jgi:hypothetical protein